MYGKPTISWWNFIDFNYLQGKSAMFGTHPFHWYITNCLVLLGGGSYIVFLASQVRDLSRFGLTYFVNRGVLNREISIVAFYILLYRYVLQYFAIFYVSYFVRR